MFVFFLRLMYINGDIIMLTDKCIFTLSNEITKIEYYKIEKYIRSFNVGCAYWSKNKDMMVGINNDLQIEGDFKLFGKQDTLYSMGAFSYSGTNLGYGVSIGRYSSIAKNVRIMGAKHFTDWVSTSPIFYEPDYHDLDATTVTHLARTKRRISIGNDVWIGENVVLKSDIKIGDGVVIAANSVVTKDVPPFMIVGGVPAKILKPRFNDVVIESLLRLRWWRFHKNDLKFLTANQPEVFISSLEEKIMLRKLDEYRPNVIGKDDIINSIVVDHQ